MSTPTTWRGDEGNTPRMTARLLRWYRLRLPAVFHRKDGGQLTPSRLAQLVDWYSEHPKEFLIWQADEEFRGGWQRMGGWRLNMVAVQEALPRAERDIEADQRRVAYAAMGPITEATVSAALAVLLGEAPLTKEPYAGNIYTDGNGPAAMRWYENRNRIHAHWPRACRECRQEFRPDFNGAVRCPGCRAAAKAEREQAKQRP
jgi:hypothetical protein